MHCQTVGDPTRACSSQQLNVARWRLKLKFYVKYLDKWINQANLGLHLSWTSGFIFCYKHWHSFKHSHLFFKKDCFEKEDFLYKYAARGCWQASRTLCNLCVIKHSSCGNDTINICTLDIEFATGCCNFIFKWFISWLSCVSPHAMLRCSSECA